MLRARVRRDHVLLDRVCDVCDTHGRTPAVPLKLGLRTLGGLRHYGYLGRGEPLSGDDNGSGRGAQARAAPVRRRGG